MNKKLRILVLNYEFPPLGGGASPVSYEIAKGYAERGHTVTVVTMHYKGLPYYEKKDGMYIYRVRCLRSKKEMCHPWEQLSFLLSAWRFLKKHLKKYTYDVNHTHFLIPTGVLAWWIKKRFKISYIITSHGSDISGYNPDRFTILHKLTPPLLRQVLSHASHAIAGSKYLANLGGNIRNGSEYDVIREGFDAKKFEPKKKDSIILTSGRLLQRKGIQYLIKALKDKDYGYELHVVGDGPMRQYLEELARESKTKVIFHGWIDNTTNKYKDLLERTSIYVLVSENENASVALLEAMSAGCVVITSNSGGVPETVGDAGVVVPIKDVHILQKEIYSLIRNPDIMHDKQERARQRLIEIYNWEKTINEYEDKLINIVNAI